MQPQFETLAALAKTVFLQATPQPLMDANLQLHWEALACGFKPGCWVTAAKQSKVLVAYEATAEGLVLTFCDMAQTLSTCLLSEVTKVEAPNDVGYEICKRFMSMSVDGRPAERTEPK